MPFDVAAVRAYCETLVAEGERLAMERVVFVDWTRARGKGPEGYRRGPCTSRCCDGGWPGPLAREYGWERCKTCDPNLFNHAAHPDDPAPIEVTTGVDGLLRWRCSSCKGLRRTRKPGIPPGFANGDSVARTARRLVDTLDGRCPWAPSARAQASECLADCVWAELGNGEFAWCESLLTRCERCRGTGHNLAGVLPDVEHRGPRR
jgi:hypothetical protein